MASSLAFLQGAVDATDVATYTFPSLSFGTAASDRYLVAAICNRVGGVATAISGVTIGGVAATQAATFVNTAGSNTTAVHLYIALVPTGTTGSVVVSYSGNQGRCGISLYSLYGIASTTPIATSTRTTVGTFGSFALSANAHVIGAGYNGVTGANDRHSSAALDIVAGSPTISVSTTGTATSWAGLTKYYDTQLESGNASAGAFVVAAWQASSGYTLAAAPAVFTLTGTSVGLNTGRKMAADAGVFALTGQAATLTYTPAASVPYTMSAGSGSFTLAGADVGFQAGRRMIASGASFLLEGSPVSLLVGRTMTSEGGSFILTGSPVTMLHTGTETAIRHPTVSRPSNDYLTTRPRAVSTGRR